MLSSLYRAGGGRQLQGLPRRAGALLTQMKGVATDPQQNLSHSHVQPSPAAPAEVPNSLLRLLGFYSSESTSIRAAEALFRACTDAATQKAWHTRCNVAEDWQSQHYLRTCYVWLVHKRLLKEGASCQQLHTNFFNEFWEDTTVRMRHAGIQELMINKNLKMVQEYSFELLMGFDHAMTLTTEDEKVYEMGGAIWGLIYRKPEKYSEQHLHHFASHLYTELETLYEVPLDKFKEGALVFADAPDFSQPVKSNRVELAYSTPERCDDVGEWRATLDLAGKRYWWNPRTRESTYATPALASAPLSS